jgi:hypothetical protein
MLVCVGANLVTLNQFGSKQRRDQREVSTDAIHIAEVE